MRNGKIAQVLYIKLGGKKTKSLGNGTRGKKGKRGEGRERKRKCEERSDAGVPLCCLEMLVTTLYHVLIFPLWTFTASHLTSLGFDAFLSSGISIIWDKQKDVRWNWKSPRASDTWILPWITSAPQTSVLEFISDFVLFFYPVSYRHTETTVFPFLLLSLMQTEPTMLIRYLLLWPRDRETERGREMILDRPIFWVLSCWQCLCVRQGDIRGPPGCWPR